MVRYKFFTPLNGFLVNYLGMCHIMHLAELHFLDPSRSIPHLGGDLSPPGEEAPRGRREKKENFEETEDRRRRKEDRRR